MGLDQASQGAATRRKFLKAAGGLLLAGASACGRVPQERLDTRLADIPPDVPEEYRALYAELDAHLNAFLHSLPAGAQKRPLRAASLLTVNAHVGERLFSAPWQRTHRLYLDRLEALGAEAIVLPIGYPILTPAFHDAKAYLEFYAGIADEIRRRGMAVVVKHNTLLPGYTRLPVRRYYRGLDASRFGKERYAEAARIIDAVRPSYLSLVGEPGTHNDATGVRLSVEQWVAYVRLVVERLRRDLPRHRTLLGAGAGTWESPGFFEGYARIRELDYVDLHIYPLSNGFRDYLQTALQWTRRVRAIDPSKRAIVGETWLYKAGTRELRQTAANRTIFARDVFRFWEPLDVKFMRTVQRLARAEGIELFAPFWTRYFFSYLDESPSQLADKRPDELMQLANHAALAAMTVGRTTATGRAFAGG